MGFIQTLKSYASIPNVYGLNPNGSLSSSLKRNLFRLKFYRWLTKKSKVYGKYCPSSSDKQILKNSFSIDKIDSINLDEF